MQLLNSILLWSLLSPAVSWLPSSPHRTSTISSTRLFLSSTSSPEAPEIPDYTGKTIYQRSFYRLSPGSQVSMPHALVIEERIRFKPDPDNKEYILPQGPRTFIFRKGTNEDEITDEIYRVNLGSATHNGPGTMDTAIATILYLASNPQLVQGDVLQLGCEDGSVGVLGCIAARFALDPDHKSNTNKGGHVDDVEPLTVPKHQDVFPPRMHHLTLSEEGTDELRSAYDVAKNFSNGEVSLKDVRWSTRIPGRRYEKFYRLILGSDIDFNYPNSKELARAVANYLLPSDEFSVMSIKDGVAQASGSFGGIGMDLEDTSSSSSRGPPQDDPARQVDPKVAPAFCHVCPDVRENVGYLKQFLENGFRMTVDTGYLKLERLQFVFQTLPEDAPEDDIEDLDLELKDDSNRNYQSLTAIHHPDYAGEGAGEYFFPLETGEYENGSRSTYLEPEEGGSPW